MKGAGNIQVCLGVWVLSEVGTDAWEGRDEERWDRSGVSPIWREIHLCILRKYRNTNVQLQIQMQTQTQIFKYLEKIQLCIHGKYEHKCPSTNTMLLLNIIICICPNGWICGGYCDHQWSEIGSIYWTTSKGAQYLQTGSPKPPFYMFRLRT